jgi:hypothetical protein
MKSASGFRVRKHLSLHKTIRARFNNDPGQLRAANPCRRDAERLGWKRLVATCACAIWCLPIDGEHIPSVGAR